MDIITAQKSYATQKSALRKLENVLGPRLDSTRWLIAVNADGRYVPTVVGVELVYLAHAGLMVIG